MTDQDATKVGHEEDGSGHSIDDMGRIESGAVVIVAVMLMKFHYVLMGCLVVAVGMVVYQEPSRFIKAYNDIVAAAPYAVAALIVFASFAYVVGWYYERVSEDV